jgi:hypothetical protein
VIRPGLIHKQPLEPREVVIRAAQILSVGLDAEGRPACWYVTGNAPWVVTLACTGDRQPAGRYLGTFAWPAEGLVLHGYSRPA